MNFDNPVTAILPVIDMTRARRFHERQLGLKTVEQVCVLGSAKAAWFQGPEGNILCLHEDIPRPA